MDVDPSAAVGHGRIARIEVNNFKSYAGRRVIGPFFGFSAVVGPNGAGKSNLMDAVSFCVGMRSSELRGKQLKDLIYRKTTDPPDVERSASVTIVYEREGTETLFKRSISTTGVGEYRVNNKVVTAEIFFKRLKAVGILVKAHNGFLVFQVLWALRARDVEGSRHWGLKALGECLGCLRICTHAYTAAPGVLELKESGVPEMPAHMFSQSAQYIVHITQLCVCRGTSPSSPESRRWTSPR